MQLTLELSSRAQNRLTNSQHTYKFKKELLVFLCNWACDCSLHRAGWPLQSCFISVSLYLTLYLPIFFPSVNSGPLPVHQKCQCGCCITIAFTYRIARLQIAFISCWQWGERQPVNLDTIEFRNASNLILLTSFFPPSYSFCSLRLCVCFKSFPTVYF